MSRDSVWRIRWTDALLIACVVAVGISGIWGRRDRLSGGEVVISGRTGTTRVSLADTVRRRVLVPGPLGETVVDVANGAARIVESPCRQRLCVKMGNVSSPGDWLACVPNEVVIAVEPSAQLDGVTR